MTRALVLALALVAVAGCAVDDSALRTRVYACSTAGDCGPGWGCVKASPYAHDFCAPSCAAPCDGICVSDPTDPSGLCLRGCTLGSPAACPSADYACIRTNVQSTRGVCYPVTSCDFVTGTTTGTCATGEECLSLTDHTPSTLMGDDLYCVPAPDQGSTPVCPTGSIGYPPSTTARPMAERSCYPTCSVSDKRCPPAFGCFTQATPFFGLPAFCVYGFYGLSCDSDANCFQGHCLEVPGQGKICTTTCADAEMIAPGRGCAGLIDLQGNVGVGLYSMQCDPTEHVYCSVEYALPYLPCSTTYPCAGDFSATNHSPLRCQTLGTGTAAFSLCTTTCTTDAECDSPDVGGGFCLDTSSAAGSICFPKFGADAPCTENRQCISNVCRPATNTCLAPPGR